MAEQVMKPEPLYAVVEIPKGNGFTHITRTVVPWIYLHKEQDGDKLFVKFMDQPLSKEDGNLLSDFLKKPYVEPPESWPFFECKVINSFGKFNYCLIMFT